MNDFLVDEIFKNAQRMRLKNQVEEKLLQRLIDGEKGIRQTLKKALWKLERSKQTVEQDASHLEREMRVLGLSPRVRKPLSTSTTLLTSVLPTPVPPHINSSIDSSSTNIGSSSLLLEPSNISQSVQRRASLQVPMYRPRLRGALGELDHPKYNKLRRSSLNSSNTSISPTSYSSSSSTSSSSSSSTSSSSSSAVTYGGNTVTFIKSLRASEFVLVEPPVGERLPPVVVVHQTTTKLNSGDVNDDEQQMRRMMSNMSRQTVNSTPGGESDTSASRRSSLPGLYRKPSLVEHNGNTTRSHEPKRVSFGHIELNHVEIPKVYRQATSNAAGFERYKQNPQMYLPDGSLRRKFSLPKLSDSLKAVSECRYIRKRIENEEKDDNEDIEMQQQQDDQDYYYNYNYRRAASGRRSAINRSQLSNTPSDKFD